METQKRLIDSIKKVCICRGVTAGTIMEAIRSGCSTFEALRRAIGVGTGNCKARRCRHNIEKRLKDHKESLKTETPVG